MIREQTNNGFKANPNLINRELAMRSHSGTSWDPEKRGEQEIAEFVSYVQEFYERLNKHAKTDQQKQYLLTEMERFQSAFANKYNAKLSSQGGCLSTMIAGPSNFPVRRAEKACSAADKRYEELIEFKDRAEAAILRELKKKGVEEAGGELEVLKKKIADAERNHGFMVKTNVIVRKKIPDDQKIKEIMALGTISEKTAREILKPDFMGRTGFPAYALSNDTANIHRMKERLKELEKREVTPTAEITFTGGSIVDNREEDRVQIFFDQKPPQAMIDKLKSEGWRWAPSVGAWSRKRTDQAMQSAERILGIKITRERFVPAKIDPARALYEAIQREKGETAGVKTANFISIIQKLDNLPLRQQEVNRAKLLLSSLPNLTLDELIAMEKTVKKWGITVPQIKDEIEAIYKEYLELRKSEKGQFIPTAPQPQVFVPAKEIPKIEDEVHTRIQKVIDIMKIYRDKGATYEDLVAGLKGYYLQQSGYVMGSNLNVQKLTDDLKKSGYNNLRELWRKIIVQAPAAPPVPVPQPQAVQELRWVFGTKDMVWHLVGPEDRDYVHGITQTRMKIIGPEAAKSEYLSPSLARVAVPVQPAFPPLLYPAPEAPRSAEEIMFVPNPETMTRDEYVKENYKRLAQVLRQQGKNAIAERVEKGERDPERTFKYETSHRDQVVLALAQGKTVSPMVMKDYPDIVGNIRKVNEEILAKIKTDREQVKAAERAEENMLNAELNNLPPALKRHAETEIYSTLRMPETHKDYRNRFYIALGKVRRIAFTHLPQGKEPQPLPLPEKKESLIDSLLNIQPGRGILIEYGDIPKGAEKITLPMGISGTVIERRGNLVAIGVFAGAAVNTSLYVKKDSQMIRIRPIPHQKVQMRTGEIVNAPEYDRWVERIRTEAPEYMPEWEKTAIKPIKPLPLPIAPKEPEVKKYTTPRIFKKGTIARNNKTNEKFVLDTDVEALQEDKNAMIWRTNDAHGHYIYLEDQRPVAMPLPPKPDIISDDDRRLLKLYENYTDDAIQKRITLNQGKLKELAARRVVRIEKGQYGTMGYAYLEQERLGISEENSGFIRVLELRKLMATQARPEPWKLTREEYWRAGAEGRAYEGRGTSDYNHREAVYKAIIAGKPVPANVLKDYPDMMKKEVPEPTDYFTLKKAQELTRENKLKLSDEQLHEKSIQIQDYIRLIEGTDEYSRKTLIKGGYYAGVIHPDVTGIVPVDIWLLQNLKFTLGEFDKERERRKQEKIKISVPTVPVSKPGQSIQNVKQQVINSIHEAKSMDELKQILKGLGFLPLPGSEKRQLIDLYQIRFSELRGELKFGERIPEGEKKKRRAPQKVPYAPPTRRLEEYGIKEAMRRGYGYA